MTHSAAGMADDIADNAMNTTVVIDGHPEGLGDVTQPQMDLVDCMRDDGVNLLDEIHNMYYLDPFFKGILASPKPYHNLQLKTALCTFK